MTDQDKFATYLLDLAVTMRQHADDYKAKIMPLGTKEQWTAWDCLQSAVAHLHSAGVYIELDAQKRGVTQKQAAELRARRNSGS